LGAGLLEDRHQPRRSAKELLSFALEPQFFDTVRAGPGRQCNLRTLKFPIAAMM